MLPTFGAHWPPLAFADAIPYVTFRVFKKTQVPITDVTLRGKWINLLLILIKSKS